MQTIELTEKQKEQLVDQFRIALEKYLPRAVPEDRMTFVFGNSDSNLAVDVSLRKVL